MSITEQPTPSQERISLADLPDVMNVKELAAFLGVSEWSVREQVDRKEIPSGRIGTRIVFLKPVILKHLGLSETDLPSRDAAGGFEPALVFFGGPPNPESFRGFARIEGSFVRFRFLASGECFRTDSFPAHRISHIEWLKDEREP